MKKICNDGSLLNSCEHKQIGNGCFYCNYFGYCDFQRPRDSRNLSGIWNYSSKENKKCPFEICEINDEKRTINEECQFFYEDDDGNPKCGYD